MLQLVAARRRCVPPPSLPATHLASNATQAIAVLPDRHVRRRLPIKRRQRRPRGVAGLNERRVSPCAGLQAAWEQRKLRGKSPSGALSPCSRS